MLYLDEFLLRNIALHIIHCSYDKETADAGEAGKIPVKYQNQH